MVSRRRLWLAAGIVAVVVIGAAGTAATLGEGAAVAPSGSPASGAAAASDPGPDGAEGADGAGGAGVGSVVAAGEPAYGDPDYHSSSAEENALGLIARKVGATDAIGYFRDGASTIVVRVPAGSATDILPSTIGGFEIIGTNSRFTSNARLQATIGAVTDAVTAARREGTSGSWSYDARSDAVVVSGNWGQDVLDALNELPGVEASYGSVEEQ